MRHRVKGKKLGRTKSHKLATMRSLALAIIEHKEIKTTLAKAKEARRYIERLITYTKKDTVHARRLAYKFLNKHKAVKVLFDEIGPTFEGRNGGYTRIIKLGQREGDGAELAVLQLVGFEQGPVIEEAPAKPKKSKKKADTKTEEAAAAEAKEEKTEEVATEEKTEEVKEKPKRKKSAKSEKAKADETEEAATAEVKEEKAETKEAVEEPKEEPEAKEAKEEKKDAESDKGETSAPEADTEKDKTKDE